MRPICIFAICLFLNPCLSAQMDDFGAYNNVSLNDLMGTSPINFLEYEDIEGDPFSNKELLPGKIVFVSGRQVDSIPLRYNGYTQKMEFKPEEELLSMTESPEISHILLQGEKYVPFFRLRTLGGYLVELYAGEYSLYRQLEIEFIDAQPPQSGYDKPEPAKFRRSTSYIAFTDKGDFIRLSQNKKRLPKQFPELEEILTDYLNNRKIKLKNEEDLVVLFREMNGWSQSIKSP